MILPQQKDKYQLFQSFVMISRACIKIVTLCAIIAYLLYIIFRDYIKILSCNIFVELVFIMAKAFCAQAIENIHLHGVS